MNHFLRVILSFLNKTQLCDIILNIPLSLTKKIQQDCITVLKDLKSLIS